MDDNNDDDSDNIEDGTRTMTITVSEYVKSMS
jgi:hypothetical protein